MLPASLAGRLMLATLVAVLPSDTAGEVPVLVTTPGGVSAAFTYTRGA